MAGRREIPRELSIYINDRQVVNSLSGITREISRTNNEMRNLNRNSESYTEDMARLRGNLSTLTDLQADFRNEIRGTTEAMDDGAGSFARFRDGLLSGDFQGAREGLGGIRAEMGNLIKSSLAFIATPIGAAIAVLSGIVIGTKALFDFNTELEVSNKTLRAFGVSAQELSKVRSEIEATAETFGKEFDEIAEKANSLSQSYGISISEANKIIADGLIQGGAQNKEFLDSIGEYDEFFSKAGFSAQEFIGVINNGFELGIYSDKLPDALKEADLALKEQTKASRDALENAFGASFSDSILARVSAGSITTKQALQEIATEAGKTGLSQQQQAQLTADIFKGAGEDAGGALKILQAIGASTTKELTEAQKAQKQLLEANEQLNKSAAALFEIEGFGGLWDVIKAQATTALADIIDYVADLKQDIQPLIDLVALTLVGAFILLKNSTVVIFDTIGGAVRIFSNLVGTLFNVIVSLLKGDFSGALNAVKTGLLNFGNIFKNTFGAIANTVLSTVKSLVTAVSPLLNALGFDVDAIQKKLNSFKFKEIPKVPENGGKPGTPSNPDQGDTKILADELAKQKALRDAARQKEAEARKTAADKKKADREKAEKEELDKAIALAKAKGDLAKAELAFYIASNRSKLDSTKALTPEIIADETKRLEDIKFLQENELANDRLRKVEAAEADLESGKINAETFNALKQTIDFEYLTAQQAMELAFQQSTDANKKQYIEEQKVLEAEQLLADNELALAEAQTKEEEENIKRQQDYDKKKADYKALLASNKITLEEYNRFVIALEKKKEEDTRLAQIVSVQGRLQELGKLANATTAIFGQNKAAASATALINGGLAVTEILKTPSVLPEPIASISRGVQIAAAAITTARALSQINKANAPKAPKFFYGGSTGNFPVLGYDEFGPMTGIVHKNEYVIPEAMTSNPRYANTIAWLESERTGNKPRKFADGGITTGAVPSGTPEAASMQNDMLYNAIMNLNGILSNGITATTYIGYEQAKSIDDLNKERQQSSANAVVNQ